MATSYSQLGILENERGGPATAAVTWHVKALAIRLRLGVPQAVNNLRRLAAYRRELGPEPFTGLLAQAAGDTDLAETITSLLDQVDAADDGKYGHDSAQGMLAQLGHARYVPKTSPELRSRAAQRLAGGGLENRCILGELT